MVVVLLIGTASPNALLRFQLIRPHGPLVYIHHRFDQRRSGRTQGGRNRRPDFIRVLTAETVRATSVRERNKVNGRKIAAILRVAYLALLEFHLRKAVVFQNEDFD